MAACSNTICNSVLHLTNHEVCNIKLRLRGERCKQPLLKVHQPLLETCLGQQGPPHHIVQEANDGPKLSWGAASTVSERWHEADGHMSCSGRLATVCTPRRVRGVVALVVNPGGGLSQPKRLSKSGGVHPVWATSEGVLQELVIRVNPQRGVELSDPSLNVLPRTSEKVC